MKLPPALAGLRSHPGMYLIDVRYDAAVAYLQGYDSATEGGLLVGFREWLVVRLQAGNNLAWPGLVEEIMRGTAKRGSTSKAQDVASAIEFMFALLEEFLAERGKHGGLRRIFVAYESWLRRQDWYGPSSPQWIAPEI